MRPTLWSDAMMGARHRTRYCSIPQHLTSAWEKWHEHEVQPPTLEPHRLYAPAGLRMGRWRSMGEERYAFLARYDWAVERCG